MPAPTMPAANTLVNAGFLFWAPLGSALPANTVIGSVFTDAWPVAWIPLGRTASGSTLADQPTINDIDSAEDFYPLATVTTKREATVSFNLLNFTATNLARALNGATTTVTGTTTTTMTQIDAPDPTLEVNSMIGYESADSTVRFVARSVRNGGNLQMQFDKAPNTTQIAWAARCVKPASGQPYSFYTAGVSRA